MSVSIVHAVMSENKDKYGSVGDQLQTSTPDKKGEIRIADWYKRDGGWNVYLECTDGDLARRAAEIAVAIANSANYGYSQGGGSSDGRWSGHKSIVKNGLANGRGNYDCSSLVISCYILAGCPNLKATGYTGSMVKLLMATGKFKKHTDDAHTGAANLATIGGVYVAEGSHTAIVTDADARSALALQDTDVGGQYVLVSGSVNVRKQPLMVGKKMMIARAGYRLPHTGNTIIDCDGNHWYEVKTDKGVGYISAFAKKAVKYTKLMP